MASTNEWTKQKCKSTRDKNKKKDIQDKKIIWHLSKMLNKKTNIKLKCLH